MYLTIAPACEAVTHAVRSCRRFTYHRCLYSVFCVVQKAIVHQTCTACSVCRKALEEEADVLCLLAKVDRAGLAFDVAAASTPDAGSSNKDGSITVVVQEGLEVLLPMAGKQY